MRFSLVDRTLDRTSGRLVEGSEQPAEVTEVWTFVRPRGRSWELSLPQLVASTVAVVLVVSLVTVVGLRRFGGYGSPALNPQNVEATNVSNINDRIWQRRQVIDYWNQRVELNKARWSPEMRATFDRNLKTIDDAIATSLDDLSRNPHDEVSEQMLNESLNDKLTLLRDFSDL